MKRPSLVPAVRGATGAVLDLVFPRRCFSCGAKIHGPATRCDASAAGAARDTLARERPLCDPCEGALRRPERPVCMACGSGRPLSALLARGDVCALACHENFKVSAGFFMRGAGARLIHAFKYAGAHSLAPFIARRMVAACPPGHVRGPDYTVPVPLHGRRLRERGYNQSLLLATGLSRATGAPCVAGLLARTRATKTQAGLPGALRAANVEGAFAAPLPAAARGRRVLLVDDVATTGATLRACIDVLLSCGASQVSALVGALA